MREIFVIITAAVVAIFVGIIVLCGAGVRKVRKSTTNVHFPFKSKKYSMVK